MTLDTNAAALTIAQINARGLNITQIASELGVSYHTVLRWAKGKTEPRYSEGLWLKAKLAELDASAVHEVITQEFAEVIVTEESR